MGPAIVARHIIIRLGFALAVVVVGAPIAAQAASGSAQPSMQVATASVAVGSPASLGTPASVALSAPITVTPVPAGELAPAASADASGSTLSQVIAVPVQGGSISVSPMSTNVTLRPVGDGSQATGSFGPVVVTDARGSLAGWTLSASAGGDVSPQKIEFVLGPARVVTGRAGESSALVTASAAAGQSVAIMTAGPGGGGGKFEISGTVTVTSDGSPQRMELGFVVR
jgi:hypothetical protein